MGTRGSVSEDVWIGGEVWKMMLVCVCEKEWVVGGGGGGRAYIGGYERGYVCVGGRGVAEIEEGREIKSVGMVRTMSSIAITFPRISRDS